MIFYFQSFNHSQYSNILAQQMESLTKVIFLLLLFIFGPGLIKFIYCLKRSYYRQHLKKLILQIYLLSLKLYDHCSMSTY